MNGWIIALRRRAARAVIAVPLGLVAFGSPATAQDESDALVAFQVLAPETALALATATLEDCRARGFQVGVVVVDRFGLAQVALRDRFAGPHTLDTAERKAWTSITFRTPTLELSTMIDETPAMAAIRDVSQALPLGGGLPIEVSGSIVGGVGVSGAPSPADDEVCATAGLEAIEDLLPF